MKSKSREMAELEHDACQEAKYAFEDALRDERTEAQARTIAQRRHDKFLAEYAAVA